MSWPGGRTEKHYDDALSGQGDGPIFLVAVRFWTGLFTGEHSPFFVSPWYKRSAFAMYGLQFHEDGRKIALYASTLLGSLSLLGEVV
jgi:hypothetical protein